MPFVARVLTTNDVSAATHCLALSSTNTVLSTQDLAACRKIENLFERAKEISRRLSAATNGQITDLSGAGNPLMVLLCMSLEECKQELITSVQASVHQGLAVGIEDSETKQLVAVSTPEIFSAPIFLSSSKAQLESDRPFVKLLSTIKYKFAQAFLFDSKFSPFRKAQVQDNGTFGILPSHRAVENEAQVREVLRRLSNRHSRELGVEFAFTIATSPIEHHMGFLLGSQPELTLSQFLPRFVDSRGCEPFAPLHFKSDFPGADTMALFLWNTCSVAENPAVFDWRMCTLAPEDEARIKSVENRVRTAIPMTTGYPAFRGFKWTEWANFADIQMNNAGCPLEAKSQPRQSKDLEREVLSMSCELLRTNFDECYGYVGNGSTEGLMWALFNARVSLEKFGEAIFLFSDQGNYCIPRLVKLLRLNARELPSNSVGEIDLAALEAFLVSSGSRPCVVVATLGSTFLGAIDDVKAIKTLLTRYKPDRHCIFGDGALLGLVLPFIGKYEQGGQDLRKDFQSGLDGIVISGHKFLGSAQPCCIVLLKRSFLPLSSERIEYCENLDTTLSTSRNGHVVVGLWATMKRLLATDRSGRSHFERAVELSLDNAKYAERRLQEVGMRPYRAVGSIIVVFDHPGEEIFRKYYLMTVGQRAHIVAHNLSRELCDRLIDDIRQRKQQPKSKI